jgi:hypothetical protein
MMRRNGRRDGPTTMRTDNGYALGLVSAPSARAMQADIDDRHSATELRALKEQHPEMAPRIAKLVMSGKRGPEVLEIVRDELERRRRDAK